MNQNDRRRLQQTVIRSENTPQGLVLPSRQNRNLHAPNTAWAYNGTGYELFDGYIVEVTGYDPDTQAYTIRRPTADSLPNIAVVVSSYCDNSSSARVSLQFDGSVLLRYSGTAPVVSDSLGSEKNSFNAKIGSSGFAPLETGSEWGGYGRCRARFFRMQSINVSYFSFARTTQIRTNNDPIDTGKLNISYHVGDNRRTKFSPFSQYLFSCYSPISTDDTTSVVRGRSSDFYNIYIYDENDILLGEGQDSSYSLLSGIGIVTRISYPSCIIENTNGVYGIPAKIRIVHYWSGQECTLSIGALNAILIELPNYQII